MGFFGELWNALKGGRMLHPDSVRSPMPSSSLSTGLRNPFITEKEREVQETIALFNEVRQLHFASPYADQDHELNFYYDLVTSACLEAQHTPPMVLAEALHLLVAEMVGIEGTLYGFPDISPSAEYTIEEGVWLREYLSRKRRFLKDRERLHEIWSEKLRIILVGILNYIPSAAITIDDADRENKGTGYLSVPFLSLCDDPAGLIEAIAITFLDEDITLAHLFDAIREQIEINTFAASGIPYEQRFETSKQVVWPSQSKNQSAEELLHTYLGATPFAAFLGTKLPFEIPHPVRFEHTHIVGGSGHGKTQLLQLLIHNDLEKAPQDGRSVVIMDSQGDLIQTISRLACFDPDTPNSLSERLLIIDPNDIEYPVCLNMFDTHNAALADLKPVDREKILNGTIDLYEYLFGAVLGAELTARQGTIFKYLARLMMEIPGATIHTFREVMEDGERFREYMEQLPPTSRAFFRTQFFDSSFNATKKQILQRLWGVLSNSVFDRMFSHKENKIDLYSGMQEGKIILINTAKELLQKEGCSIFGRFFVALIAQAALRRAAIPQHERNPAFVYIDEAHDYFDDNIDQLLIQARKYKIALLAAHQTLDQLTPSLRASLMSNTSIKFAGGVSTKDASAFSGEMHVAPDFIKDIRKEKTQTNFACYVRNVTPQAISVAVPLGYVDGLDATSEEAHTSNLIRIRDEYTAPPDDSWDMQPLDATEEAADTKPAPEVPPEQHEAIEPPPKPDPAPKPTPKPNEVSKNEAKDVPPQKTQKKELQSPPTPGRGGKQHKYLQRVIQKAGEECGFLSSIEEEILNGAGFVDVSLQQGKRKIAVEISVTTSNDHELANVEKCLAAGYEEVVLVCANERKRTSLEKTIIPQLEPKDTDRVSFMLPEEFVSLLFANQPPPKPEETTIRGYKVKATQKKISDEETKARREAIAKLIAKSMGKPKG